MTSPEFDYGPESQFAQTTGYFDRLLEVHGRAPVEGEIGGERVDASMQIDPKGDGYRLHDIGITRRVDGAYIVHQTYDTYTFDPRFESVTLRYFMGPWRDGPAVADEVSTLDNAGQRDLIVTISNALHEGKVIHKDPVFPAFYKTRTALAALLGRLRGRNDR